MGGEQNVPVGAAVKWPTALIAVDTMRLADVDRETNLHAEESYLQQRRPLR